MDDRGEIIIYQTEDGLTKIDVSMQGGLRKCKWQSCFKEISQRFPVTLKTFSLKENWMKKWLLQNLQQPVMLKPFVYCHVNSVFMGFVGILEENKLTRYIKIQCVFANQLNICTRVKYLLTR